MVIPFHEVEIDNDGNKWGSSPNRIYLLNKTNLVSRPVSQTDLAIHPNPTCDCISFNLVAENPLYLNLYNTTGIKVMETIINTNKIDVSNLRKGLYFVTLQNSDNVYTSSFVKI